MSEEEKIYNLKIVLGCTLVTLLVILTIIIVAFVVGGM